jgi:dTDP-4-dehydrorhamnose 3,5-epimerase
MTLSALEKTTLAEIQRQFIADTPLPSSKAILEDLLEGQVDSCHAYRLRPSSDERGDLFELLTTRGGGIEPIVHVYQVWAEPGSIRAWVYHARQFDRLCFTGGSFRVALCDLRTESPTAGAIASIQVGAATPVILTIAPLVAHGVRNIGSERSSFVNLPTCVYDCEMPDKCRLPFNSSLIPFRW